MDLAELSWKRLDNKQNKYVYFQCLRSQFQKKMDFNGNEDGAEGGTRTRTGSLPLPPQDSVSTSSTTTARSFMLATTG